MSATSPFSVDERRYINGKLVVGECENCDHPLGLPDGKYLVHLTGAMAGDSRGCGYWVGYKNAKLRKPTPPTTHDNGEEPPG